MEIYKNLKTNELYKVEIIETDTDGLEMPVRYFRLEPLIRTKDSIISKYVSYKTLQELFVPFDLEGAAKASYTEESENYESKIRLIKEENENLKSELRNHKMIINHLQELNVSLISEKEQVEAIMDSFIDSISKLKSKTNKEPF